MNWGWDSASDPLFCNDSDSHSVFDEGWSPTGLSTEQGQRQHGLWGFVAFPNIDL